DGDRLYRLEAPISSDAQARDGQAFSRDRLATFRDQINGDDQPVPLMVDHGKSDIGGDARYSVLGRVGTVDSADLEADGDTTLLRAEMSVADPDALAEEGDAGEIEAALRYLKYQAETMGLSFSVGWDEESERTGGPSLLEVSAVALPSDVAASTAGVEPTEAATRGFEALPKRERNSWPHNMPDDWGLRGFEPDEPTDVERAEEALDRLQHVREFHDQDGGTPPALATVDELLRLLGYSVTTASVEERLGELRRDGYQAEREREDVLGRLDTIDECAQKLAQPQREYQHAVGSVTTYPFGRSGAESRDRIEDAVATLREVVTGDDGHEIDGWGMAALEEG
ncbi:hypothetical protein, partial [Halorientalis regularis]